MHDPNHVMDSFMQICKADESAARALAPGGRKFAEALATDLASPADLEPNPPALTNQQPPSLPFKVQAPQQTQ